MSISPNEFLVYFTTSHSQVKADMEVYCLQAPACSYAASTRFGRCRRSQLADYNELQSSTGALSSECNIVELEDASFLYAGADCTDCSGVLERRNNERDIYGHCPIGTEMVLTVRGGVNNSHNYWFYLDPRAKLVNDELPADCKRLQGWIWCPTGQQTLRISRAEEGSYCDASDETVDCPFPVSGYPYGDCAATKPCPAARALLETELLN